MLCRYCRCLDLIQAASDEGAPHHDSYSDLVVSAETGCDLYATIQSEYEEVRDGDSNPIACGKIVCWFNKSGNFVGWKYRDRSDLDWLASFAVCTYKDNPVSTIVSSRPISPNVASDQVFETIGNWLSECQQNHEECARYLHSQLPSRVIDIGAEGRNPFLFTSQNQPGKWIALSYCWGSRKPPQTLLANLEDRCQKIPIEEMPSLFLDAMEITRRLGCAYLWIDSLCIIQDCPKDWKHESARMGDIYSKAHLTIAAEASMDCADGIFDNANMERPRNTFQIAARLGEERPHGNLIIDVDHVWDAQTSRGPLSTRSWTLQENLLSRRVLLYTGQQLWWQCREMQRSERQPLHEEPSNLPPDGQWDSDRIFPLTAASSEIKGMNSIRQAAYYQPIQCWYRTVNDFCSRKTTYRGDTLPAISGIARQYYRHLSQDYAAGVWRNDIHRGLVWSVPCSGASINEAYVAPSFSWASLNWNTMRTDPWPRSLTLVKRCSGPAVPAPVLRIIADHGSSPGSMVSLMRR